MNTLKTPLKMSNKFKLQTTQSDLIRLIGAVNGTISHRNPLPILNNVMLKSGVDGTIAAVGNDLDREITATGVIGDYEGSIDTTISCKKLFDILQTMSATEPLELTYSNPGSVVLKGAGGKFSFGTIPSEDFPRMQAQEEALSDAPIAIPQSALKSLIDKTAYVTPTRDMRYYLVSSQLVIQSNVVSLCSTDGHRLAMDSFEMAQPIAKMIEVLLPRSTVLELKRLLKYTDEPVTMFFHKNQARFSFGGLELITKLVDGKYPDVSRVIPKNNHDKIGIERSAILLAVQRAAVFVHDKESGVVLHVSTDIAGGRIDIAGKGISAAGESVDVAFPVEYSGPPIVISYKLQYLLDSLANMAGERITLALDAGPAVGQALFTVDGDPNFKYVLMPMRM
jgi:DNA polymerase III subunit beta